MHVQSFHISLDNKVIKQSLLFIDDKFISQQLIRDSFKPTPRIDQTLPQTISLHPRRKLSRAR